MKSIPWARLETPKNLSGTAPRQVVVYNDTRISEGRQCEFEVALLSKFWCTLAFVEQYWNDVKRVTREQCDYTMPRLKAVFPVALATACPVTQIRKYMRRSLDHVDALIELGRDGDFSKIPSLRKKYKSHRRVTR